MNKHLLLKICRHATLAVAISVSMHSYADTVLNKVVAVVDSQAILESDLDQAVAVVKQQGKGQNLPPDNILRKQVLEQLILREAQIEQVKRYNIQPDESALNTAVLNIAKQEGVSSLTEFQQKLDSQQAGSYALMRAQVAEELSLSRLRQQLVMSRIKVSERDIDNFLKSPQGQAALGQQVHVLHFRVAGQTANTPPDVLQNTAQSLKQAMLTNNDMDALAKQFTNDQVKVESADMGTRSLTDIPSDLAARLSGLQVGQVTDVIPAADGLHILKLLDRTADSKKAIVTEYQTRHILIQPSEVVSPADAKQRIDQLYQRLQQGADFAELAATYSNDPGSARDGGSLGWVSAGAMVPEFEQVMKSTPVGQISAPFQSQFGWHILKVDNTRQVDMTEQYQRRMAKQILAERQFDTEVDSWLRELRANAYVDIKDPTLAEK